MNRVAGFIYRDNLRISDTGLTLHRQASTGTKNKGGWTLSGADERSRTSDLLITNQLLYQLSYVGIVLDANARL